MNLANRWFRGMGRRGKKSWEYDHNAKILVALSMLSLWIFGPDCFHFSMCPKPLFARDLSDLSFC